MKILATLSVLLIVFISIVAIMRLRNFLCYRSKKKIIRSLSKFSGMDLENAVWPSGDFGLLHTLPSRSEFLSCNNELTINRKPFKL